MKTGEQYRESLGDGRLTYFEGERVDDLAGHPLLGQTVDFTADAYDKYYDPTPGATSELLSVPESADDLRELIPKLHDAGMMAHVTSTSIQTLKTAAGRMDGVKPDYIERIERSTSRRRSAATSASPSASPTPRATAACRPASRTTPTSTSAWSTAAATASSSGAPSCTSPAPPSVTTS